MTVILGKPIAAAALKPDDFESWLGERPKWVQTAARLMLDNKSVPSDAELEQLSAQCIAEAGGPAAAPFLTVIPGSVVQAGVRPTVSIRAMNNVRGVNRIKDQANLSFGTGSLVAVYGANGAGKTGYSRALKQACGCRLKEDILSNVYEKTCPPVEVTFVLEVDGKPDSRVWTQKTGKLAQLSHVDVFDTRVAANYVSAQNAARYEPSRMRFITALIATCTHVVGKINLKKATLVSSLPQLPTEFASTTAAKFITALSAATAQTAIDAGCAYTKEEEDQRVAGEQALAQKDGATRLQAIPFERSRIIQVYASVVSLMNSLSDERVDVLLKARKDATSKRDVASLAAKSVFSSAPLSGVGEATWLALWEKAREFSAAHAYPEVAFPNTSPDARCVLCQEPLTKEGQPRLTHFESFVKSGLEADAQAAEKAFANFTKAQPQIPAQKDWDLQAAVLGLEGSVALQMFDAICLRSTAALVAADLADVPQVDWTAATAAHDSALARLAAEEKTLSDLQIESKRKEIEAKVRQLRASQWLSQNRDAITVEVERKNTVALLDKAAGLCGTSPLTRKHTELANLDLDKAYQNRFKAELRLLGGHHLPVLPLGKQEGRGNMTFGLALQGAQQKAAAEKILSEGETRIVALAAFLADTTGLEHRSPFVFDDPISSLDQAFEERVVRRLVDLAKTRQVIVFTHRLSLLALLEDEAKRLQILAEGAGQPAPVAMHVETVATFGKDSGISQGVLFRDMKPDKGVKRIQNDLPALRKMWDAGDLEGYDGRIGGICTNIRILTEKCVETTLVNGVLVRFRRAVQTQGRLGNLAKINKNDCMFIEDLMTRYSVFEHSQPEELPAARPDISEVEADVAKIAAWLTEFEKRTVT